MRTEGRVDGLHHPLDGCPACAIGIPVIYRIWISAGFVLNDCPDVVGIQFTGGDAVLFQDLDRLVDPLLDVARRRAGRWAAARAEAATAPTAAAPTTASPHHGCLHPGPHRHRRKGRWKSEVGRPRTVVVVGGADPTRGVVNDENFGLKPLSSLADVRGRRPQRGIDAVELTGYWHRCSPTQRCWAACSASLRSGAVGVVP